MHPLDIAEYGLKAASVIITIIASIAAMIYSGGTSGAGSAGKLLVSIKRLREASPVVDKIYKALKYMAYRSKLPKLIEKGVSKLERRRTRTKGKDGVPEVEAPDKIDKNRKKGYSGDDDEPKKTEVDSIKGKLNGEVYGQKRLNTLKKYLNRRDAELTIDDPKLPSRMRGAYNGRDNKVYLRADATEYEVWHELSHYLHRKKIGKKEYMKLERPTGPEQYVYDQLRGNDRRWKRLTPEERDHAMWYVEASGGVAW
jgi:hypothetical protein